MKRESAGSVYLMGLGLLLVIAGGVFTWLLGASYRRAVEMREWPEVDCLILESAVRERQIGEAVPVEFRFAVLYGYEFGGDAYTSERLDVRGHAWVKEREKLERYLKAYPEGAVRTCRVNPENPDFAILKVDTKAPGYTIWFPLLFVIGGLVMIGRAAWRLVRKSP